MPLIRRRRKLPLRVEDVMSTPPIVIVRDEPIEKAAKLMCDNKVSSVLVVDKDGKLVGIITERDIVFAVASGKIGKGLPVWMFMTENPVTVTSQAPLTEALEKMRSINVRHLPVVDDEGKPVGALSIRDVVEAMVVLMGLIARE